MKRHSTFGIRHSALTREDALQARPIQVPPVASEEEGAKLRVTVQYRRPGWQRFLGADNYCRRTYRLDTYGREVYDACDGDASVKEIIRGFARSHKLSKPEAEKAVTTFMKTLMSRGLIAMTNAECGTNGNAECRMRNDEWMTMPSAELRMPNERE